MNQVVNIDEPLNQKLQSLQQGKPIVIALSMLNTGYRYQKVQDGVKVSAIYFAF
jgi:hypothetical protein